MDEGLLRAKPEHMGITHGQEHIPPDYEYSTLINMLQVSVSKHLLDEHFTTVWANDYFFDTIKYSKEEFERLFHNNADEYFHNDMEEFKKISGNVLSALKNKEPHYGCTCKIPQKGGGHIQVRLAGTFTGETVSGLPVVYTVFTDITDLVQAQAEQPVTYDNLPGFIAKFRIKDAFEFELTDANERFNDFFRRKKTRGASYSIADIENECNRRAVLDHYVSMRKGEPVRFIVQVKDEKENDVWLQVNADCTGRQNGDPIYLVIFIDITDVTQQRELQQKLKERSDMLRGALDMAERASRAKSDFLSRMSHDIRTPMNAIMGMVAIAKDSLNDTGRLEHCLEEVEVSAKYLLSLINDILDMSKIESGKMVLQKQKFNFVQFLREITATFCREAEKKRLDLRAGAEPDVKEFYIGDEPKLRQILVNLLSNAVKFTHPEGFVELSVAAGKRAGAFDEMIFTVRDNGPGMEPAFLEKLFQPFEQDNFQRENFGGSGLGLAIAQNYIHMMNGTILVKSEPGRGSEFTVRVWLDSAEKQEQAGAPDNLFFDKKALVADRDPKLCAFTAELLRRFGVSVQTAQDAAEALVLLEEEEIRGTPFDLLVIDRGLPKDGFFLLAGKARQLNRDLVIGVSAYDCDCYKNEARQAGIDYFLPKPLFASTVYDFLMQGMQGGQAMLKEACKLKFCGERILLAEDNDINLEIAQTLLESRNLIVDTARNGQEAVDMFQNNEPGTYCAVLMDIQMPVMNGLDATRAIRSLKKFDAKTIPIIATSANAFDEDVEKSLLAGMNAHISKPVDIPLLFKVLYDLINQ